MGTRLQNVVLKIVVMEQKETTVVTKHRELANSNFSCRRSTVIVFGFVLGISKNEVTPPFAQARVA